MHFRERTFSAHDGLRLYYRDYGDPLAPATPVLCLPGLTRNAKDFEPLAGRLAGHLSPSRRVVCPDYRGRGRSAYDRNRRNYRAGIILRDLTDLLIAANLHRVIAVGTSFGGLLALGLCVALPGAVAGVVLNDSGPELAAPGLRAIFEGIRRDRPQPDWRAAERTVAEIFPNLVFRDRATWQAAVRNSFRPGDDGMLHFDWDPAVIWPFKGRLDGPAPWPLFNAARNIPMLAIRGGKSDVLTAGSFDRMQAARPGLIRLTVAGSGHAPSLDEPEARTAIDEFLARY